MAKLPPLARTVAVGSTWYRAGDTPALDHARKITNPRNWEGGKVPDFDDASEPETPATGVRLGDAANTARGGLPGVNATDPANASAEADVTGTGNEGAGSGGGDQDVVDVKDEGDDDPDDDGDAAGAGDQVGDTGDADKVGDGQTGGDSGLTSPLGLAGGDATKPIKSNPRKRTPAGTQQ